MNENRPADNKESTLKGLRIQSLSLWMVGATIVVSLLIGSGIVDAMRHHRDLADVTQKYILTQNNVKDLLMGTDYLTEQARFYVVTGDCGYAEAYFREADVDRRRDGALEEIRNNLQGHDDNALRMSEEALDLSNELMDLEIHSMKLAALAFGEDIDGLAPEIRDYSLTEEEMALSVQEKSQAAFRLIFGPEYSGEKRKIEEKLEGVSESAIAICSAQQVTSEMGMRSALIRQGVYTVLIVLLVVLSYIMIAVLILRPIRIYVNCIKNNHVLDITGAYEFKYFAATYNNVYEMSLEQQDVLRRKAECDALTGLLNRQAFEQLKQQLHGIRMPIALLLIDVDVFKSINDTYGHEVGDQALIKVAQLLSQSFRTADYVLRIGGDEFAVVMEKMQSEKKQIISDKIDKINWELQHPVGDFPKYSVSVGAAFSENGYEDEIFRQADRALYHTKENGRCGYTFYNPDEEWAGLT